MNNEIIVAFEPYIKSIASKFYNVDYEDLMQAGRLGLQDAYQHYKKMIQPSFLHLPINISLVKCIN